MPFNQELYDECLHVFHDVEGQEINILNLYMVLMKARHGAILEVGYKGTSNYVDHLFFKEFSTHFSSEGDEEAVNCILRENDRSPCFHRLYDLCSKHNLFVINRWNEVLVTSEENKKLQRMYILGRSTHRGSNAIAKMIGHPQLSKDEHKRFSHIPNAEGKKWRKISLLLSNQKTKRIALFYFGEKRQLKGTMDPQKIADVILGLKVGEEIYVQSVQVIDEDGYDGPVLDERVFS